MTSFAFIFGCLPLWTATGAGAGARRILGTSVVTGMLAATVFGIFFIPALFVAFEKLTKKKRRVSVEGSEPASLPGRASQAPAE
jgi:HAE1 family hydrophobic/amphiphilic exporter-1